MMNRHDLDKLYNMALQSDASAAAGTRVTEVFLALIVNYGEENKAEALNKQAEALNRIANELQRMISLTTNCNE